MKKPRLAALMSHAQKAAAAARARLFVLLAAKTAEDALVRGAVAGALAAAGAFLAGVAAALFKLKVGC